MRVCVAVGGWVGQCVWDGGGVYVCSVCVVVGGWVGQCVWVGAGVYACSVCCLRARAQCVHECVSVSVVCVHV